MSHSTAEAGELSPRDPVEGRGHRQVAPLEGKTANTPRRCCAVRKLTRNVPYPQTR